MSSKIIDFNKSKQKLIEKMYPNVSPIVPKSHAQNYISTNKALDSFQEIFLKYQESINDEGSNNQIALEEVLVYFNRFFDEAYKELVGTYDLSATPKFKEAMDYAMLCGGKRIRPFLMLATYYFCLGDDFLLLTPFLVSIELIHTFSLIHDDLPCIDNDTLRRGKPTLWKKYGEDIAVLTGDALLAVANSILIELIYELAYTDIGTFVITSALILTRLSGLDGMITGEVYDVINTNNKDLTLKDIIYMYDKKTTALITASIVIGANLSTKFSNNIAFVEELGMIIGESYQIKDDLLEIESTEDIIGKSVNSDINNNKITYVKKVGIEKSKERLNTLYDKAMKLIDSMGSPMNTKELKVYKEIIKYVLKRDR